MTEDLAVARRYLAPAAHSFWKWDDAGEVIAWADGTTIAFRGELVQVLERLAPDGLPPLSAVVLLLAACHESWRVSSSGVGTLAGLLASVGRRSVPTWLPDVLGKLDAVVALPPELRNSPRSKATLAEVVVRGEARPHAHCRGREHRARSLPTARPPRSWRRSCRRLATGTSSCPS